MVPTPRVITFAGFTILVQEKPFYRIFENFSLLYLFELIWDFIPEGGSFYAKAMRSHSGLKVRYFKVEGVSDLISQPVSTGVMI